MYSCTSCGLLKEPTEFQAYRLVGKRRKVCKVCDRKRAIPGNKRARVQKVCEGCEGSYFGNRRYRGLCSVCRKSGALSPTWKGGHRHWQAGKVGRDKDGLSWKQQRQLAWERDSYICQHCGKRKDGWRPDVHHVKPYRLSFSHALDNLICLCRRCHKREEARIGADALKVGHLAVTQRSASPELVRSQHAPPNNGVGSVLVRTPGCEPGS